MKEGDTTIVPIRDFAFQKVLSDEMYAFPTKSDRRILDYMAFYRTEPTSSITHYAKVDSIQDGTDSLDMQYRVLCFGDDAHENATRVNFEWVKELDTPVTTEKYGIQGTRITTEDSILSSETVDDLE